jgi:RHS repeat-associated protein
MITGAAPPIATGFSLSPRAVSPKTTYLIGPRGLEYGRDDQTQATQWCLYDGLGSVLGEVDPLGNLTASRKRRPELAEGYDVYGLVRAGDNGTSRHRFVGSLGHTSEDEIGLICMRARWMDPTLGRFISEDPARDGSNWFEYCGSSPTGRVDRKTVGLWRVRADLRDAVRLGLRATPTHFLCRGTQPCVRLGSTRDLLHELRR